MVRVCVGVRCLVGLLVGWSFERSVVLFAWCVVCQWVGVLRVVCVVVVLVRGVVRWLVACLSVWLSKCCKLTDWVFGCWLFGGWLVVCLCASLIGEVYRCG